LAGRFRRQIKQAMVMSMDVEKIKKEIDQLIDRGTDLLFAMQHECRGKEFEEKLAQALNNKDQAKTRIKNLPGFIDNYQQWYSESYVFLKQVLPDRLADFVSHFERPKNRKEISSTNYVISDYLKGTHRNNWEGEEIAGPVHAIGEFRQQLNILKAARNRFDSSLFDIKQVAQADLYNSEIQAAKDLAKNKFLRAAGMICGVVLEKHLHQACQNHGVSIKKKSPSISDFNDALKNSGVIDTQQWRKIQWLADIRNLSGHNKEREPSSDEIDELIRSTDRLLKTMF
jgi:hypothetical protein